MKRKIYLFVPFLFAFLFHFAYSCFDYYKTYKEAIEFDLKTFFFIYLKQQDYFLSFSYGFLILFTVYSFLKFREGYKKAGKGIFAGSFLTVLLSIGGCFFMRICSGCLPVYCFSCPLYAGYAPLAPVSGVYLLFIGSKLIGVKKLYIFLFTLISVIIGYFWIKRKM